MAGRVCARSAGDELDEHKEEEVEEVHRCECHSNIHTHVPVPKPEATRYGSETPNEETAIEIPCADPGLPARRLLQVDSSARRLRQVGWSARRLRQEPFDEPSARLKYHWRAFSFRAECGVFTPPGGEDAEIPNTIRATQDCSKLGTPVGKKWFSRICEGEHQVEPDPNVHNQPSRRLHHWRHHQRNFMIAHFQIQVPARAHHRLVTEATGQRAAKHHEGDPTQDPIFTFT